LTHAGNATGIPVLNKKVTNMSEMFYHASNFNIENISKWNTSSIETRYMIAGTKGW
jgi:surface protein